MFKASRHSAISCCLIAVSSLMVFALFGLVESPASAFASAPPPVAAYSFDEGEGETAEDVSGNGHTATLEGATWARGKYGSGLSFDGENDCVSIAASEDLQLTEEFTLEAWIRPTGAGEEANPFLTMEDEGAGEEEEPYAYTFLAGESEVPKAWVRKSGEAGFQSIAGKEALPEKAWAHLALTDDGAKLRLYVDGELVRTTAAPSGTAATGPLKVGCAFGSYFEGRIDEVRIYNRVLNEAEVQGDKSAPIQTPQQGPVAAYSFDEGEGETAEDLSGNGHTATLEGATWARGRYGDGLSFDGENDCVSIAATSDLQLTEEFTLEAWIRPTGAGEEANPFLTMEDTSAGPTEEEFAYTFLAGESEVPKAWVRKSGEEGFQSIAGTEPLPEHAWAHLALTDDGAQLRLYVNGELVRTTAAPNVTAASGPLKVGCGLGAYFEGRIDEVRIYNRVLGEGEVAADKSAPIQTPQQGPVAAYSFDEGEGETAEDVTGNGHTATLEGATWARGRYGDGLSFNGTSSCVSIEATPDLQLTEEFSLETWIRPTGSGEEANPFLTMEDEGAGEEEEPFAYTFLAGESEVPKAWVRKSGEEGFQGIYGKEPLPEHAWAHLALTDDGAHLRLYVDGELVRTTAAPEVSSATGPLTIGCDKLFPAYFEGRIDEVRIYNRVLGEAEVQVDRSAPIQTPQQGPVAAYSFDEGEGETAEDLTGNEHTATLEGATWARGKYGDGLEFDGKEDCVSIEATPDLQFSEEFTLEAWVRPEGEGEEALPVISMADESSPGEEEPFAYELLGGQTEIPKAWVRKGGESGFRGVYGEEPLSEHAWTHLALSDDGAHIRLFVDGQLIDTNVAPNLTTAEGPLEIGCGPVNGTFQGRIDEVRIYNRVLGEAEVQGDKSAPIQTPQQGPVAAYSFDEGEGTTAEDLSGNGHTATLEGAEWARGRYGDGLEFNGTSSCASIAASEDLQLTEEFTLEAWIRPTGSGEEANPFLTMEDEGASEEEEPFAYTFLAGENEVPKAWVRKSGEAGFQGIYGKEPLPEHAWAHLALSDDGAKLRLYVNGELVRTTAAPEVTAATGPLTIGCDKLFPAYFEGRIDEVRIYNRAISRTEILRDERYDITAPTLTLSGSATEPISETEGKYTLSIDATDGGKAKQQSGVTEAFVSVDGIIEAEYSQRCPKGNCSFERTWEYDPTQYQGFRHNLTVTVTDGAGNSTTQTAVAALATEGIRRCSSSEGGGEASYTTEELPGGGVNYVVQRGSMHEETPYTPEGFDPLKATAEELELYGIPPRPPEGEGLGEWVEMMEHWTYSPPAPPNPCAENASTSRPTAASIELEPKHNKIWSGWVATSPGTQHGYDNVSTEFVQPASHETTCSPSDELTWVGIGGQSYVKAEAPLIQAGTKIDTGNHIRAWWEYLGENVTEGLGVQVVPRKNMEINSGDHINISVWWNKEHDIMHFAWFDFGTTKNPKYEHFHKVVSDLKEESRFYHNDTADFLVERETVEEESPFGGQHRRILGLKNFKSVVFGLTHATRTTGENTSLGEDLPEELAMYNGKHRLAETEGISKSGLSFADNFFACE